MTNDTERHMIQIQETGDTPKFNTAWVDEWFPNSDIDITFVSAPCFCDRESWIREPGACCARFQPTEGHDDICSECYHDKSCHTSGLAAIVGRCQDLKTEEELMEHVNPGYPCMPEHPPYSPPALEMDRLYRIQMDLANGLSIERNDTQALLNEILRLQGYLK